MGKWQASGAERGSFSLVSQSWQMGKQSKTFLPYSPDMALVSQYELFSLIISDTSVSRKSHSVNSSFIKDCGISSLYWYGAGNYLKDNQVQCSSCIMFKPVTADLCSILQLPMGSLRLAFTTQRIFNRAAESSSWGWGQLPHCMVMEKMLFI